MTHTPEGRKLWRLRLAHGELTEEEKISISDMPLKYQIHKKWFRVCSLHEINYVRTELQKFHVSCFHNELPMLTEEPVLTSRYVTFTLANCFDSMPHLRSKINRIAMSYIVFTFVHRVMFLVPSISLYKAIEKKLKDFSEFLQYDMCFDVPHDIIPFERYVKKQYAKERYVPLPIKAYNKLDCKLDYLFTEDDEDEDEVVYPGDSLPWIGVSYAEKIKILDKELDEIASYCA